MSEDGLPGLRAVRLHTGRKLTRTVAWYGRSDDRVEAVEPWVDRTIVHMVKTID